MTSVASLDFGISSCVKLKWLSKGLVGTCGPQSSQGILEPKI